MAEVLGKDFAGEGDNVVNDKSDIAFIPGDHAFVLGMLGIKGKVLKEFRKF